MPLKLNGISLARPYLNGQRLNACLNGVKVWPSVTPPPSGPAVLVLPFPSSVLRVSVTGVIGGHIYLDEYHNNASRRLLRAPSTGPGAWQFAEYMTIGGSYADSIIPDYVNGRYLTDHRFTTTRTLTFPQTGETLSWAPSIVPANAQNLTFKAVDFVNRHLVDVPVTGPAGYTFPATGSDGHRVYGSGGIIVGDSMLVPLVGVRTSPPSSNEEKSVVYWKSTAAGLSAVPNGILDGLKQTFGYPGRYFESGAMATVYPEKCWRSTNGSASTPRWGAYQNVNGDLAITQVDVGDSKGYTWDNNGPNLHVYSPDGVKALRVGNSDSHARYGAGASPAHYAVSPKAGGATATVCQIGGEWQVVYLGADNKLYYVGPTAAVEYPLDVSMFTATTTLLWPTANGEHLCISTQNGSMAMIVRLDAAGPVVIAQTASLFE